MGLFISFKQNIFSAVSPFSPFNYLYYSFISRALVAVTINFIIQEKFNSQILHTSYYSLKLKLRLLTITSASLLGLVTYNSAGIIWNGKCIGSASLCSTIPTWKGIFLERSVQEKRGIVRIPWKLQQRKNSNTKIMYITNITEDQWDQEVQLTALAEKKVTKMK